MILETEVWVTIGKLVKHFEKLGYKIPKYIDKQGRLKVKKGTKLLVKINDLPRGSNIRVTKICDECGTHVKNQQYKIILDTRLDNKDLCFKCGKIKGGITKKNNIKYEQSLEYYAKENNMEYLLEEFSSRNNKKPSEIPPSTTDIYIWNCLKCKGEYHASLNNRLKPSNCPYCSNKKVLKGYNDLWTTHPEVASLLKNKQRGYEITYGIAKKEEFICNNCGFEQTKNILKVITRGLGCPKCSDGISYPEKFTANVLDQLSTYFETQKVFNWSENKRYDFYIPKYNLIIEVHGGQHFNTNGFGTFENGRTLNDEIKNDERKIKLAKNNVENYIILDCRESTLIYIKNSIIKSKLNGIFDLNDIDWLKCHEFACNSLVKVACDLWNNGVKETSEIGKILKLNGATINRYLKQGVSLDWCDYDPKLILKNNIYLAAQKSKKKIIQFTLEGNFIREWDSISDAEKNLNIHNIYLACKGKRKSIGKFKWMYKENMNNK